MKLLRLTVLLAGCVVTLGVAVLGGQFSSYLRTAAHSIEEGVKDSVPIEFELKRARDLIDEILPELRSQIHQIAHEEVQIAALKRNLQDRNASFNRQKEILASLQTAATTTLVSHRDDDQTSENVSTERLATKLETVRHLEAAIDSDRELLRRREQSLAAATELLERTRDRKHQLQQKVEALAAKHRLLQSQRIVDCQAVDGTNLRRAEKLLEDLDVRLSVAEKVLDYGLQYEDVTALTPAKAVSRDQVLSQIDEYLAGDSL